MVTYFERPERGWTPIPNELIHAAELKPVARLVLMHALSNRADWEEPAHRIAQALGVHRDTVTAALHELVKAGFARQTSKVTAPRRPPMKGWDFAWPAFTEEIPRSEPKRNFPVTVDSRDGESPRREIPATEDSRSGVFPSRENPAPLLDVSSNETIDQLDEQDEKINKTPPKPPADPAPEDPDVTMLNFNDIPLAEPAKPKPRKTTRRNYEYTPDFLAAWDAYGRVGAKQAAFQAWNQAIGRTDLATIMEAIPNYLASEKPQSGFTQYMATWLNGDGWESESAQPKKKGYQGKAGSDARPAEVYMEASRRRPICKLMRNGPMPEDLSFNRAWYYHWNVEQQRDWTVEQMLATGNTPDDVDWLMDAYANGIDPELYARMKRDGDLESGASK